MAEEKLLPFNSEISDPDDSLSMSVTAELATNNQNTSVVASDPYLGTTFEGKYRIDAKIGEGGMGVVYRATHVLMERTVAIKFLSGDRVGNNAAIERFKKEARAAGRIQHPHATAVLDFGMADNTFYLVMEYLEGRTLRTRIRTEKEISDREIVRVISQVCEAVDAAHKCGIIHRDLKPDNIFLQQKDDIEFVKVLDFGIAKIVHADNSTVGESTVDSFMGTPFYMSPEQFQSDQLTPVTDIYSLGIIIFELFAGKRPFTGETVFSVGLKHMSEPVPSIRTFRPDLPAALDEVLQRALAKNPIKRQTSALQLAEELRTSLQASNGQKSSTQIPQLSCANPSCGNPKLGQQNRCLNCNALFANILVRHRYEIQRVIDKNDFGFAYMVKDRDCFNEHRILKELQLDTNEIPDNLSATAERRFKREAIVLLTLQHPGIPKLYAFFSEQQHNYLVQDYVSGETLFEEINKRKRPLSEEEAIEVLMGLADILEYLHSRSPEIIHRDIRAHNILRQPNGQVQLTDFSAVCLAANTNNPDQTMLGTPGYTPPEQIYGKPVPQSDLYAAGATIVHLMTGIAPGQLFNYKTAFVEWDKHLKPSPKFGALLRDMMLPFVEQRLASAAALKERLAALSAIDEPIDEPEAAVQPPPPQPPPQALLVQAQLPQARPIQAQPVYQPPQAQPAQPTYQPPQARPVAQQPPTPPVSQPPVSQPPQAQRATTTPDLDFQSAASFCYEVESFSRTMSQMNHYALLGIERNATDGQIRQAYQKLSSKFHPDRQNQLTQYNISLRAELEKICTRISEAYQVLIIPQLRNDYDRSLRGATKLKL